MMWREKNVLFVTTDSGRQMVASTNRKRAYRSINKAKTRKFSVMFSLSKHLAEACLNNGTNPTLAEEKINNSNTLPRGIRKNSFPRDSSATLGMTEVVLFINERAGDHWSPLQETIAKVCFFIRLLCFLSCLACRNISRKRCLNNGTNPTLAAQRLNNSNTLSRGIRKNSFPRDSSAPLGMTGWGMENALF